MKFVNKCNRDGCVGKCNFMYENVDLFGMIFQVELQIYLSIEFAWELKKYIVYNLKICLQVIKIVYNISINKKLNKGDGI